MAGTATEIGSAAATAALTSILGILGGDETPEREPTPTAPSIERPALVFGLPIATVVILAVVAFVLIKMGK